jgi:hypothetical protein
MAMSKQPPGPEKLIICLLATAVLVVLFASLGQLIWNRNKPDEITLPDEREVVSIRAVAHGDLMGMESTPEFAVPQEYIPVILGILNPAKTPAGVPESWFDPPFVDLQIAVRSGRVIKIQIGWSGQNPLCFIVDGVRCVRGGPYCLRNDLGIDETARLLGLLLEIYREQTGLERSERLSWYIEELEWSTGRRLSATK